VTVIDSTDLVSFIDRLDNGQKLEFVHGFFLDGANRMLWSETLARGCETHIEVDLRGLLGTALRVDAHGLIVAHNHPSGVARPSSRDVTATYDLQRICARIRLKLYDHLIVAAGRCFSFRAEGLLET